ncbi:hypothetical protein QTA57_10980 [Fontisubflavum oceani]|uniref:hypothetical protein n=1 Tax=Fontisubflavum oceani TaxID=2978973 RepID=UPI0025B35358|nr:hypothetical protein [Fontisubflavum oceani]WJY20389.1 hypothetical protein QTA57_10980 [Fontisubflavum oceani]
MSTANTVAMTKNAIKTSRSEYPADLALKLVSNKNQTTRQTLDSQAHHVFPMLKAYVVSRGRSVREESD